MTNLRDQGYWVLGLVCGYDFFLVEDSASILQNFSSCFPPGCPQNVPQRERSSSQQFLCRKTSRKGVGKGSSGQDDIYSLAEI